MRLVLLAGAAGVWALQQCAQLPSRHVILACMAMALVAGLAALGWRPGARRRLAAYARHGVLVLCAAALGFSWAALRAEWRLADGLNPDWERRDVTVVGVVSSLPAQLARGVRFGFDIETGQPEHVVPRHVQLSWYAARGGAATSLPELRPGQRWRLTIRLKRPHGAANPQGFDYEAWLLAKRIRATGYVRTGKAQTPTLLAEPVPSVRYALARWRDQLRRHIHGALPPDARYAGVLTALTIGDQRAIAQSDWQLFQRTGVNHLLAISGLHIALVGGLAAAAANWLWRHRARAGAAWPILVPAQRVAALAGLLAALGYAALAGFGIPAQRSLYMLSVVALAYCAGRRSGSSHVMCWALAVVVMIDPWAVLAPGFWLSFGAVSTILYAMRLAGDSTGGPWRVWQQAAHVQYAVTLGMVPLTLALFAQVSVVGPLANALAIPLVSVLVTPMALAGALMPAPMGNWLLQGAHFLIEWLTVWLRWLDGLPLAVWRAPRPPWWLTLMALVGVAWLLAPRGWPMRWAGAGLLLPLLLGAPERPADGEFRLLAFDVGQGTAVLVETAGHRLLYDTGPRLSAAVDAGARVIVPYLYARGIEHLDMLVVSHQDDDHAGGAGSVLAGVRVSETRSSLAAGHPIVVGSSRHRACRDGQSWVWDGVRFEMLHPDATTLASSKIRPNGRSCVLRVSNARHSALLPGDIERAQEAELLARLPAERLAADIVVAPHHGSLTSSTSAFVAAVSPRYVIYQAGYLNRFGHPREAVTARYAAHGATAFRTDRHGAVEFRTAGELLRASAWRIEARRYWMGR